ncbi:Thiaminase-2 [Hartmannibacter diazotrophicus]|uniref:Aminopyrimidine aminohydrolase n=1 Tax=Hartmannibacter diazotrophicus TaxID=1482074 RepID=A0A2C9D8C3_9HYPH|nr:thiaminase II [Hartmannibacter diazotrophicus]SON56493.1 Thiaminase-2 [Hartmannibacter diazotrophicus]
MTLFDRLKAASADDWTAYVEHDFVRQLGEGTLPVPAFRTYLVQDYLFLIHFARAYALGIFKGRHLADMRSALASVNAILGEMDLHVGFCAEWGISEAELERTPEERANTAYTRFVIDAGLRGDLLDLHVALAPCVIGYAEIARRLAATAKGADPANPYARWIAEYSGEAYAAVAEAAIAKLDSLGDELLTEKRFTAVSDLFAQASRLEADFWQMGLDAAG